MTTPNRHPQHGQWGPQGPHGAQQHPHGPQYGQPAYGAPSPAEQSRQYEEWQRQQAQQQLGPHVGAAGDPAAAFITKVFGWMTLGLGITAIVAYLTMTTGLYMKVLPLIWPLFFAQIAVVFGLSFALNKISPPLAIAAFLGYAGLNGLTLSIILMMYTAASVAQVFVITTMTFGFMFVYGWTTKKDLTSWGSLLFMGLIGLILASVANMFFGGGTMTLVISVIGVLIFVGLTAYDAQSLKRMGAYGFSDRATEDRMAIFGALKLYLDFINLFIYLLRLLGDRR